MKIDSQVDGQNIILKISGRIDTTTSGQLQSELMLAFQKGIYVVLDFEDVEYISSAGLRTLLIGHKTAMSKAGNLKIIHVSQVVREIFDMTGFSQMLHIE